MTDKEFYQFCRDKHVKLWDYVAEHKTKKPDLPMHINSLGFSDAQRVAYYAEIDSRWLLSGGYSAD